ncbi:MAG: hypothetical protein ISS76_10795 [Phycisphaerae bacterium]|nr:hypothetical protein [Phycisphaerae bacterium]
MAAYITTDIARAIVDMNRAEHDRGQDGIVKTHTCYNAREYIVKPTFRFWFSTPVARHMPIRNRCRTVLQSRRLKIPMPSGILQ